MRKQTQIKDIDVERTLSVIWSVETRMKYSFCYCELVDIIQHTIKKCETNAKDEEYFYILLDDELEQYLLIAYINMQGEENRRRREQLCAMSAE